MHDGYSVVAAFSSESEIMARQVPETTNVEWSALADDFRTLAVFQHPLGLQAFEMAP